VSAGADSAWGNGGLGLNPYFSLENEVHPDLNRVPRGPMAESSADLASLTVKKRNLIQ
jgi:hypothetical protein